MRRGGTWPSEKPLAGPDAFLEELGHALVEPDGHVGADREVGELVERLVLERPPERVAALAFEERGQQVAAGHVDAARVAPALAGEAEVVLLTPEEVDLHRRGGLVGAEVGQPALVLLVHPVHPAGEVLGQLAVEVGVDAVVLASRRRASAARRRRLRTGGAGAARQCDQERTRNATDGGTLHGAPCPH